MSGLENMRTRLNYMGGQNQVARMNSSKLKSLKKALLYSYQAATAVLADGREFLCLINPDKLKISNEDKILSIPFEDIRVNKEEGINLDKTSRDVETIGVKAGDVITWKENNTQWLVYLQKIEEIAYFRAEIRRCNYTVEINGVSYAVPVYKNSTDKIDWLKVSNIDWNALNDTLTMYITKDENTLAYFHRFSIIKINNKPYEIQTSDSISADGIIVVCLKEYYQNTIEEEVAAEMPISDPIDEESAHIDGPFVIYPYDTITYTIANATDGFWVVDNEKVDILSQDSDSVKVYINTGKSGKFNLIYRSGSEDIILPVTISSL